MLGCLLAEVLILSFFAFYWLLKRGNHDELFPIAILCLGIPPLGILLLFLTFRDRYQKEKMQPGLFSAVCLNNGFSWGFWVIQPPYIW
jgi:hypothetical protein